MSVQKRQPRVKADWRFIQLLLRLFPDESQQNRLPSFFFQANDV